MARFISGCIRYLQTNRSLALNILFLAYALTLSPWILRLLDGVQGTGRASYLLAAVIFLSLAAESVALYYKLPYAYSQRAVPARVAFFRRGLLLPMFHGIVSGILVVNFVAAAGLQAENLHGIPLKIFVAIIILRGAIVWVYTLYRELQNKEERNTKSFGEANPWWVDLLLFFHIAVATTVIWDRLLEGELYGGFLHPSHFDSYATITFLASLVYLMYGLPIQMPWLLEPWLRQKTRGGCAAFHCLCVDGNFCRNLSRAGGPGHTAGGKNQPARRRR